MRVPVPLSTFNAPHARAVAPGFTLVELVVVIAITGVIAAIVGIFILRPIQGYDALVRRAELVDYAESALRRMQRDIRRALPNSVRIRTSTGSIGDASCPTNAGFACVLELLHTIDGGRYRADPPGGPFTRLQFGVTETDFDVLGTLHNFSAINTASHWLAINNQTTVGNEFNAYFGDNRAGLAAGTTATHINIAPTNFPALLASPRQRFHIVNTPVTYLCDSTARVLNRYENYTITADHADIDTHAKLQTAGAASARAANNVAACRFIYHPGTSQRAGVATIDLTVRDPGTGDQVRLLHQVHVPNVP